MANYTASNYLVNGDVDKIVNWKDKYNQLVLAVGDVATGGGYATPLTATATTPLLNATGSIVKITGNTTITSFGSGATENIGSMFTLIFEGSATITNNTTILCPGGTNITTFAGVVVVVVLETTTVWRVLDIQYPVSTTNTANSLVRRDASGNFSSNVISATDFNTTSDIRLKKNINKLDEEYVSTVVNSLEAVEFDWKDDQGHAFGFIAQDVDTILPDLIVQREDGYMGVSYVQLVPFLVKEIQTLNKRVQSLEAELTKGV